MMPPTSSTPCHCFCSAFMWLPRVVFLGALSIVAGCDSNFEPFTESGLHYTLLGYLDTDADTQFVRVVPFRPVVDRLYTEEIDAVLRSTDLDAGTSLVWQDSVVHFPDSSYGHVFWSRFRAAPGHKYRIEVERSDGSLTWAETVVPEQPADPDSVYGALNETADFAPLFWPGVDQVISADVLYDMSSLQLWDFDLPSSALGKVCVPPSVRGRRSRKTLRRRLAARPPPLGGSGHADNPIAVHRLAGRHPALLPSISTGGPTGHPERRIQSTRRGVGS